MAVGSKTKSIAKENIVFDFVKGLIVSIILSFALIIVFALFIKWLDLSDVWIVPITLLIKAISVLLGSIIAIKGTSRGLIKGAVFGTIYILFAFVIFGTLAGSFSFDVGLLLDFAFAALLGAIVGIIKVNRN